MKQVVLFNPRWCPFQWPHYGLVLLASRLAERGHQVLVVDYNFTPQAPSVPEIIRQHQPDIIGVSLFTICMQVARGMIREIRANSQSPVVLGGPHASLYSDELAAEQLGDWIFAGECEETFLDHLADIRREERPVVIKAAPPDMGSVPRANFELAWGGFGDMVYLPIQLSRGCPYGCSFCSVRHLSSRKVRYRDLNVCLDEIEENVRRHPAFTFVRIVDDCPTFDMPRFKQFLREFLRRGINRNLHIDNLRGDNVDEEFLELLKQIGIDHLCIGVESGNPEVFALINKGETLDQIVASARMIKKHGIRLYNCFVIGLPGATAARDMDSIRLARSLKPKWIFWNLFQPHKGTKAREWFEQYGHVYPDEGKTSLAGIDLSATEAPCDTDDYPLAERSRIQLMAMLMTGCYLLNPFWFFKMARTLTRNRLWGAFIRGLPAVLRVNTEMVLHRISRRVKARHLKGFSLLRMPRLFVNKG